MSQVSSDQIIVAHHVPEPGSARTYVSGFILSLIFTLTTYLSVVNHWFRGNSLITFIIGLALVQFLAQLFFFLHLGKETKPRWKLLVLFLMIGVVLILVLGSLWIMSHLNYRMTPQQMNQYLKNQDGGL